MKAKLIKQNGIGVQTLDGSDYFLTIDGKTYHTNPLTAGLIDGGKLSYKNCQAIERGYDLDELVYEHFGNPTEEELNSKSEFGYALHKSNIFEFKKGFQKALEILGGKKFSEEDIKETIRIAQNIQIDEITHVLTEYKEPQILKMLNCQFSEWDVEIEMDCPKYCDIECDSDCYLPNKVPKLDSDGCLILKGI